METGEKQPQMGESEDCERINLQLSHLQGCWDASRRKAESKLLSLPFQGTLIFRNDLGSQHLQLISASILREILCAAHPCAGTFSIQLSHLFNLIISSREALYGLMESRNTQLLQESAQGLQLQLRVTTRARLQNTSVCIQRSRRSRRRSNQPSRRRRLLK